MFIDAHCHLDVIESEGNLQLDEVITRAENAGVKLIITNGETIQTNQIAFDLSKKYNIVAAAMGLYPIDALKLSDEDIDKTLDFIREHKEHTISIGEVGMDFKEGTEETKERQKQIFSKVIDLAIELNLPLTVHSRKAERECIELLEEKKAKKVIMHCFSGKLKLAERIVENKWYLTVPTCVKHSQHFQQLIKRTPIEQLLCETDSPYLHPDKTFPNEPAQVIESYKKIAEIKGLLLDEVEEQIEENFNTLFKKS